MKEKSSILDWIGYCAGALVIGFLLFILVWPVIDPTPGKSSSLEQNFESLHGK